jgi:uncharacterized protein (DUF1697 family)
MALVVFLQGIDVGGHRRFRPSILAGELSGFDAVNVGAAGTLAIRRPGSRAKFRAEFFRKLPFKAEAALCYGRDLLRLKKENPFETEPAHPDVVRFVSILSKAGRCTATIPFRLPPDGEWFVRPIAAKEQFVCGVHRRQMKTIGYLGQIDKIFGTPATARNWNTILAVVRSLKASAKGDPGPARGTAKRRGKTKIASKARES